jgi:hypothetical protein
MYYYHHHHINNNIQPEKIKEYYSKSVDDNNPDKDAVVLFATACMLDTFGSFLFGIQSREEMAKIVLGMFGGEEGLNKIAKDYLNRH